MATYKTPEELRAWSRSFQNKSKIIKRGFYNYIADDAEENKDNKENSLPENQSSTQTLTLNENSSAEDLASSILANDNASKADISSLFDLDSSEIDEMNSKFPTTQELMSISQKTSSLFKD